MKIIKDWLERRRARKIYRRAAAEFESDITRRICEERRSIMDKKSGLSASGRKLILDAYSRLVTAGKIKEARNVRKSENS